MSHFGQTEGCGAHRKWGMRQAEGGRPGLAYATPSGSLPNTY